MGNETEFEPVEGVRVWVEQEAVHLKAVDPRSGDPVELAEHEVEAVISALQSSLTYLRRASAG